MRVVVYSAHQFEIPFLQEANVYNYELKFTTEKLSKSTIEYAKECDVVALFTSDEASEGIVNDLAQYGVKLITTRSTGFNHIDLKTASSKNIVVTNVPEYSPNAIAEHCVSLMLSISRKLIPSYERIRNYNFSLNGLMGSEINKKTIGVMGTGSIGICLIQILQGFGCSILAYDVNESEAIKKLDNVNYVSIDKLLSTSDIISLNLPLNKDTEHIINTSSIKKMKDGAILINAGRGKLVDTKAVIEGIKSEKIGGFGMDVYENEDKFFYEDQSNQIFKDDIFARLLTFKNVLVTAHQAFLTETALKEISETTMQNIKAFDNGDVLQNEVN